jgi:hypothetical protein
MAEFWLGDFQLDRWVFRSLRHFSGASVEEITAEVCWMLADARVIKGPQQFPDDNDVWCSLQRLTLSRHVDKYVADTANSRGVRYRIHARK